MVKRDWFSYNLSMNFEQKSENAEIDYLRNYFSEESIIRNESGLVTEIKLPRYESEDAVKMVRSLEKIGVTLTAVSFKDGLLELALRTPEAIAVMLQKVITSPSNKVTEYSPEIITQEWTSEELTKIEVDALERQSTIPDGLSEPYSEDVLDLMEQGAVSFYQGISAGDDSTLLNTHNPRFSTDGKFFKQKFFWEDGKLSRKDGTPVTVAEHKQILENAKTSDEALAVACQIHEGLVRWIVDRHKLEFSKRSDHLVDTDDLLQAGREGLIKALRRTELPEDEDKAVITKYLIEYIKGGMLEAIYRDKGGKVIKPPENVHHTDYKTFRVEATRQLEDNDFNEPDLEELRKNTNFDIKKVRDLYQVINQIPEEYDDENPDHQQDYYRPDEHEHEEDLEFGDQFENYTEKNLKEVMNKVLITLTPRRERIIRLRFFSDLTLEEIAAQYGVNRERIRQIEARALRDLKHPSRARKLRSFLD